MFGWTDRHFDPRLTEFTDFLCPDAGAVDEVVALDDAVLRLDSGHVVVGNRRRLKVN